MPDGVREVTARRLRRLTRAHAGGAAGRLGDRARVRLRRARLGRLRRAATSSSRRWRRASRRGCCARPGTSGATRSRTRWCGRRCTTRSRSCAARACTGGWVRRWCACAAATSTRTWRCWRTTSRRPRRSSARTARSTSRSPPPGARIGCSPGRRRRSTTARRCGRASWRARSTTTCARSCCWRWARPRTARGWRRRRARRSRSRSAPRASSATRCCSRRARAGRGGAVVGAVALGPRAGRRCSTRRWRRCPRRTRRCARGCWRGCRWSSTTRVSRSCGCRLSDEAVAIARRIGRSADAWRPAWTRATTRCGCPRTSRSGWRSPPSCGAWRRRPATPSSSCRARAGRSST